MTDKINETPDQNAAPDHPESAHGCCSDPGQFDAIGKGSGEEVLGRLEQAVLEYSKNESDDIIRALRDIAGLDGEEPS